MGEFYGIWIPYDNKNQWITYFEWVSFLAYEDHMVCDSQ